MGNGKWKDPELKRRHGAAMRILKTTPTSEKDRLRMLAIVLKPPRIPEDYFDED